MPNVHRTRPTQLMDNQRAISAKNLEQVGALCRFLPGVEHPEILSIARLADSRLLAIAGQARRTPYGLL